MMKEKTFLEKVGVIESKEPTDEIVIDERDPVDVKILSDGSHLITYSNGSTEHVEW